MPVYRVSYSVLDASRKTEVSNFFDNGLDGIGKENMFRLKDDEWMISYGGKEKALMDRFNCMKDYLEVFATEVFVDHVMLYVQKEKECKYIKWISNKVFMRHAKD